MKVSILNLYVRKPTSKSRKQNARNTGKVSKMCSSWRLHLTLSRPAGHRHGDAARTQCAQVQPCVSQGEALPSQAHVEHS